MQHSYSLALHVLLIAVINSAGQDSHVESGMEHTVLLLKPVGLAVRLSAYQQGLGFSRHQALCQHTCPISSPKNLDVCFTRLPVSIMLSALQHACAAQPVLHAVVYNCGPGCRCCSVSCWLMLQQLAEGGGKVWERLLKRRTRTLTWMTLCELTTSIRSNVIACFVTGHAGLNQLGHLQV